MSEAVRVRSSWVPRPTSPEVVGAMANTAAAAEIAVRAAAGAVGVRAITALIRDYPLLSVLLASGAGFLLGNGWRVRRSRSEAARTP